MSLLSVQNLGKAYRSYRSEWLRIARWFGLSVKPSEEHWVLRNVSFDIQPGESIGILGKNGAGKSTLLKMITGTLQSSEGCVQVNGRIAAILELGMGFNPELTGRQNVFHAAGLMGFSLEQIEQALPDIKVFADIGDYFDHSVRTYSSGMQARVAFAVATAFRPDILIVDEALAVGDAAFQRKCFRRLDEFVEQGTTLLFVSHDTESIKKICKKALHIADGRLVEFGEAKHVCDHYEKALFGSRPMVTKKNTTTALALVDSELTADCEVAYGDGRARIESIWLENSDGQPCNVFESHSLLRIRYRVSVEQDLNDPVFAFMIKTREGTAVSGTDSEYLDCVTGYIEAGRTLEVAFELKNTLAPGIYYLNCGLRDSRSEQTVFIHRRVDALLFRVVQSEKGTAAVGLVDLAAEFFFE